METVSLAEAKARLSELLDKVESGEELIITRRGRPIAKVSAVSAPKKPVASLAEFRARMPKWRKPSVSLIRRMRDESE